MSSLSIHRPVVAGISVASMWMLATAVAAHQRYSNVTWTNDIQPIVQRRCLACHRPGGYGPMSLAKYAEAKAWASSIKQQVLERAMPPWSPGPGFEAFTNDQSLTPIEQDLIVSWADGGTPEGMERSNEHPLDYNREKREPDLIVWPARPEPIT